MRIPPPFRPDKALKIEIWGPPPVPRDSRTHDPSAIENHDRDRLARPFPKTICRPSASGPLRLDLAVVEGSRREDASSSTTTPGLRRNTRARATNWASPALAGSAGTNGGLEKLQTVKGFFYPPVGGGGRIARRCP